MDDKQMKMDRFTQTSRETEITYIPEHVKAKLAKEKLKQESSSKESNKEDDN